MSTGTLIYCGTQDKKVMPRDWDAYENVIRYIFPLPGQKFFYSSVARGPVKTDTDLPYGLMVIDDIHYQKLDDWDGDGRAIFSTRVFEGTLRCLDLETKHGKWGVVFIPDGKVTEAHIAEAKRRRREFLEARIKEISHAYNMGRAGKVGYPIVVNAFEQAVYAELGKKSPDSLDAIPDVPKRVEDSPCPRCKMAVMEDATYCRHCQFDWTPKEMHVDPAVASIGETLAAKSGWSPKPVMTGASK